MLRGIEGAEYVVYINLAHRVDRREATEREMHRLGVRAPRRFDAIRMPANGALGCTLSHVAVLEMALREAWPYVIVVEDDICFTQPDTFRRLFARFLATHRGVAARREAREDEKEAKEGAKEEGEAKDGGEEGGAEEWDVLLLAGLNNAPFRVHNEVSVRVGNCQTTTGYMVPRHYMGTLLTNFREGMEGLRLYPHLHTKFAVDMYWKRLQLKDRWFLLAPQTVVQRDGYSDIEGRPTSYGEFMLSLSAADVARARRAEIGSRMSQVVAASAGTRSGV